MITGYTQLETLGCLRVEGPDALSFLQGQLSCDFTKLNETHSRLAVYCNLQGRVVASLRCFIFQEAFYLLLAKDLLEKTQKILNKYALFSKVEVSIDDSLSVLGCINLDGSLAFNQVRSLDDRIELGTGLSTPRQFVIAKGDVLEDYQDQLAKHYERLSTEQWILADIQDGIVTITESTSEQFVPHRLNYQYLDALDFEKGCYLGQEIVARMHYRGQLKHHCHHLKLNADAPKGDIVMQSGQDVLIVMKDSDLSDDLDLVELPYSFENAG